jgi:hypothetical protein
VEAEELDVDLWLVSLCTRHKKQHSSKP